MLAVRTAKIASFATMVAIYVGFGTPVNAATTWTSSSIQSPGTSANVIESVSCATSTFCIAAGYEIGSSGYDQTLIEQSTDGSGANWTAMASVDPAGTSGYNDLYGISCVSVTFCVAAGSYEPSSGSEQTLSEIFNGSTWATSPTVNPVGAASSVLNSVSCITSSMCAAAGYWVDSNGNNNSLVEMYNGSAWSIESTPNPGSGGINALWGISCAGPSYCLATGEQLTTSAFQNLAIESTDGGVTWSTTANPPVEAGPAGGTSSNNDFVQVACIASSDCFATGFYLDSNNQSQPLVETYNGSWTLDTAQSTGGTGDQDFPWSVGCESLNLCFMVGGYSAAGTTQTLIEQSTDGGATWSLQTGQGSSSGSFLYGVSCVASSFCVAAGNTSSSALAETTSTPTTCNTSSGNLSGQNLAGCNLASGNLQGKNLKGANLTGANLSNANAQGSNLKSADLSGADLTGADAQGANLSGAVLSGTILTDANLQGTNLSNADLSGADLSGANLTGANLKSANLTNANLSGANLTGITWSNTTCPDGTNSSNDGGTCINNL